MTPTTPAPGDATPVGPSTSARAVVWIGFPLLGAGVGWLLTAVADWAASLPWIPWQGPFELVASIPEPLATIAGLALGVVVGLVLAFVAERDYVTATVDDDQVALTHGDVTRTVRRAAIDAVFLDGKQLVLLGQHTEELARIGGDLNRERFEAAFRAHGYPWRSDGDPHAEDYRRWVKDLPGLPAGADALFTAYAHALRESHERDAEQLRDELAKLGIVTHARDKHPYWRRTRLPAEDDRT